MNQSQWLWIMFWLLWYNNFSAHVWKLTKFVYTINYYFMYLKIFYSNSILSIFKRYLQINWSKFEQTLYANEEFKSWVMTRCKVIRWVNQRPYWEFDGLLFSHSNPRSYAMYFWLIVVIYGTITDTTQYQIMQRISKSEHRTSSACLCRSIMAQSFKKIISY